MRQGDAFGQAMYDRYCGKTLWEIIERDDGHIDASAIDAMYFAEYRDWPAHERRAIQLARGRVLDIGCGVGRAALYLQKKGLDVLGIDISPLALKVCKLRGVRHTRLLSITQLCRKLGVFDTLLMYGNNFGLVGNPARARWLLRRFYRMTAPGARIIAETLDPYRTREQHHRDYHERNRRRGRMPGQVRIRVRYQRTASPYFDYLFVSQKELAAILDGTGWHIARVFVSDGSVYIAVLEKTA